MNVDLITLNKKQFEDAQWNDGPFLIMAGSGKTRVLTHHITRIINDTTGARFRVLVLNFTNQTAGEMRTQLDTLLKTGKDRVLLTTFYLFAAEILRQHGCHIGVRPDFTILFEQTERELIMTEAMKGLSYNIADTSSGVVNPLLVIDKMLTECLSPAELADQLGVYYRKEFLSCIFKAYRAELIKINCLDFASITNMAVQLLEERPVIAKQFQRVYPYVCVSGLQDINEIQFRLLCALVPEDRPNLFVVADDQLICQRNDANFKRFSMKTV